MKRLLAAWRRRELRDAKVEMLKLGLTQQRVSRFLTGFGLLAGMADLTGALAQGTGILLTVMIIYRLYEEIAKQHMMDMHPMMRKFMGE